MFVFYVGEFALGTQLPINCVGGGFGDGKRPIFGERPMPGRVSTKRIVVGGSALRVGVK